MLARILAAAFLVLGSARVARADDACECNATPAACDPGCACDPECEIDWSADECAAPDAGCLPETSDDEATVETEEAALPDDSPPVEWAAVPIVCAEGATNEGGRCVPAAGLSTDVSGGCSSSTPGLVASAAVVVLLLARRRRWLLVLAACAATNEGWDDALDRAPSGDTIDVYAAELAAGTQYLLAGQPLAAGADEPTAQFSLSRASGRPLFRTSGACGDQLTLAGGELLGYARADAGDGTAELVELAAPDACTFAYETDPDAIADLVAQGYTRTASLGYVWPPGLDDPAPIEPFAAPAACRITRHSAVELLYSSPGHDESLDFLKGCPGEVIIGEKGELGPVGPMTTAAAHAAGGRTAFILDRNGDKLRALLARPNGVERTAAYLRHKLALGYDYIVIDEITAAPDFADGHSLNRRVRKLLGRLPARTVIPYLSIDIMQELSPIYLRDRRLLVRAFHKRGRAIALEVYLHTGQVMAGSASSTFRRAADRLASASAIRGINRAAFTTIATSMHSTYAQYRYLDQRSHDLAALRREFNALRHASRRTRSQHGIGFYFVGASDMDPHSSAYTYAQLIHLLRTQALRFR